MWWTETTNGGSCFWTFATNLLFVNAVTDVPSDNWNLNWQLFASPWLTTEIKLKIYEWQSIFSFCYFVCRIVLCFQIFFVDIKIFFNKIFNCHKEIFELLANLIFQKKINCLKNKYWINSFYLKIIISKLDLFNFRVHWKLILIYFFHH